MIYHRPLQCLVIGVPAKNEQGMVIVAPVPLVPLNIDVIVVMSMPPVMAVSAHMAVFVGFAITVSVATTLVTAVITVASVAGSLFIVLATILLLMSVPAMAAVTGTCNQRCTHKPQG